MRSLESTLDVDILLDPNVRAADDSWIEFKAAIATVGKQAHIAKEWMNEEVGIFIAKKRRWISSWHRSRLISSSTEAIISKYLPVTCTGPWRA